MNLVEQVIETSIFWRGGISLGHHGASAENPLSLERPSMRCRPDQRRKALSGFLSRGRKEETGKWLRKLRRSLMTFGEAISNEVLRKKNGPCYAGDSRR